MTSLAEIAGWHDTNQPMHLKQIAVEETMLCIAHKLKELP